MGRVNLAADLSGTFVVLDVNVLAFAEIIKYERGRTLRDRLDSSQVKGGNWQSQLGQFVYVQSCFENLRRR